MEPERLRLIAKELQLAHSAQLEPVLFHGMSMLPFLRDGDELIVAPIRWEDIRPGDILTYRFEDKFPTRRVVARAAHSLWLRADNWPGLEYKVERADVLGRVVARHRRGVVVTGDDWHWILWSRLILARYRARRVLSPVRRWWRRGRGRRQAAAGETKPVA
jgi:Peptidase S24-like